MAEPRTTISKPKARFHWLLLKMLIATAIGLAISHTAWDWQAEHALRAQLDQIERINPSDFRPKVYYTPPDDGGRDLLAAAAILEDSGPENEALNFLPTTMPANPKAWPHLARARQWYDPALRRLEHAQGKKGISFNHNFASPIAENLHPPELNAMRELANLLSLVAVVEHHDGRHDLVVRRLGQMLFLADIVDRGPSSVGHFVAGGINHSLACRVEQVAPVLMIGDGAGHASTADVRKLIGKLNDETAFGAGLINCVQARRMEAADTLVSMTRNDIVQQYNNQLHPILRYVARPYVNANALRAVESHTEIVEIAEHATNWAETAGRVEHLKSIPEWLMIAQAHAGRRDGHDMKRHFEAVTDRRLAATALAIRLYHVEHGGASPRQLEELVPGYLPAVPIDAMAAGNRRLSYLPRADHPVLYSVGRNGDDDGGSEAAMANRYGEVEDWERLDRAFYLTDRPHDVLIVERPGTPPEATYAAMYANEPVALDLSGVAPWEREDRAAAILAATAAATQPAADAGFTPR
jgi:hypothetical protein